MPNIKTYTNPIDKLQPSEIGADAWNREAPRVAEMLARAGQTIGQAYEQSGSMLQQAYYSVSNVLRQQGSSYAAEVAASQRELNQYEREQQQALAQQQRQNALNQRQMAQDAQSARRQQIVSERLGLSPSDTPTTVQQNLLIAAGNGYLPTNQELEDAINPPPETGFNG